jgi:2,3-bisphosphoglycerate-independent phosphoglycerate mutase
MEPETIGWDGSQGMGRITARSPLDKRASSIKGFQRRGQGRAALSEPESSRRLSTVADFRLMQDRAQLYKTKMVPRRRLGTAGHAWRPNRTGAATRPNLNRLAGEGTLGQSMPVGYGITPGSGPGHLGMFGYDPLRFDIGRGVLEAFGIGVEVGEKDVAARGNFCTLDSAGLIADRRAGRIATDAARPLVEKLAAIRLPGVTTEVRPVKEHRFVVVFRGDGLSAELGETDPQRTGVAPLAVRALEPQAARSADLFNQWLAEAKKRLANDRPANMVTLRGFSGDPRLPKFGDIFKVRAACVAVYPMYRGVAKLVGMQTIAFEGDAPGDEFAAAARAWNDFDYFFIHISQRPCGE